MREFEDEEIEFGFCGRCRYMSLNLCVRICRKCGYSMRQIATNLPAHDILRPRWQRRTDRSWRGTTDVGLVLRLYKRHGAPLWEWWIEDENRRKVALGSETKLAEAQTASQIAMTLLGELAAGGATEKE